MKAAARNAQVSQQVADLEKTKRPTSGSATANTTQDEAPSDASIDNTYGYYFELSSAKDVRDFKRRIENIVKRLGFGDYAFVRLATADGSRELISITADLIEAYDEAELYEYDMALMHAAEQTQAVFRSEINEYIFQAPVACGEYTRCMHEINELNKSFGYFDYYTIPIKASNGNGNVSLSLTRRGLSPIELKRRVQQCVSDLQLLCEAIDFVSTRRFANELLGPKDQESRIIKINPRPLEVLSILANNDLNITEVASQMGINAVTANRHLQAARKAFGVRTNYAAIKQGILNKLIEYK